MHSRAARVALILVGLAGLLLDRPVLADGIPLGPFQFFTTRADDPNDLFSHEHLRVLRGFFVFASWINHIYASAPTTLDMLIEEDFGSGGVRYIRHYLIDFFSSLGAATGRQKEGNLVSLQ